MVVSTANAPMSYRRNASSIINALVCSLRMLRQSRKINYRIDRQGQNAVEYILVFVLMLAIIVAALAPGGFLTRSISDTMNMSVTAIENMVNGVWP